MNADASRGAGAVGRDEPVSRLERDDSLARGHEWWGLVFGIAALVALLLGFVVSWFYLRFAGPEWPLHAEPPAIGLALVVTAIALASLGPAVLADWGAPRERRSLLATGAAGIAVLAATLVALLVIELARADLQPTADARGSLFHILLGFVAALAAVGVVLAAGVAIRALRGDFTRRHHVAVHMLTTWWYFVVLAWIAAFVTLYLAERILDGG